MAMAIASCRGPSTPPPARACRADQRLALGACVSPPLAARLCGPSAQVTLDGCAPRPPCERGRARDLDSGACVPARDVRTLASTVGIMVAEDEALVCPDGELVTAVVEASPPGPRLGCLPLPHVTRAAAWPIRTARGVDVGAWLRAAIGPEGGQAAAPLCDALKRGPSALAVAATTEVRVEVTLVFPDNDVSQVIRTVRGSGAGTAELEGVVGPMVEALQNFGGTADQASIGTSVICKRTSERPRAELLALPGEEIR